MEAIGVKTHYGKEVIGEENAQSSGTVTLAALVIFQTSMSSPTPTEKRIIHDVSLSKRYSLGTKHK